MQIGKYSKEVSRAILHRPQNRPFLFGHKVLKAVRSWPLLWEVRGWRRVWGSRLNTSPAVSPFN